MGVASMLQGAPLIDVVPLALASLLLLGGNSPASGQNRNQGYTKPAGTASPPASTRSQVGSTRTQPVGTPSGGKGGVRPGGGKGGTPVHTGSGGGSDTGAIAAGAIGAAIVGVSLFEHLHHAHGQDEGHTVQRLSLTLRYPEDWQQNPRLNLDDDPISFNNFGSSYVRGGIIPPGGADIDVARFPVANRQVSEVIASELADADNKTIDSHTFKVDGQKATRVFYTDVYAPNFSYTNVAIYLARADGLYKFFLTYHQGDSHEKNFNDDFEYILKSVRFQH